MKLLVGVLAFQGSFREHTNMLYKAGVKVSFIGRLSELNKVDALIIPGGESTVISHMLLNYGMTEPLSTLISEGLPCYGSCAGMILLAKGIKDTDINNKKIISLKAIDIIVRRNAFGSQINSFEKWINFKGISRPINGLFIRAPWVEQIKSNVEILAHDKGKIIAVRQKSIIATSFHLEVTGNDCIHKLFVNSIYCKSI